MISPAPASSSNERATSAVTRTRRARKECAPELTARLDSFKASLALTDCIAGITAKAKAAIKVMPSANQSTGALTGIVSTVGMLKFAIWLGNIDTRKRVHQRARTTD